jgi:hypothetical protein
VEDNGWLRRMVGVEKWLVEENGWWRRMVRG